MPSPQWSLAAGGSCRPAGVPTGRHAGRRAIPPVAHHHATCQAFRPPEGPTRHRAPRPGTLTAVITGAGTPRRAPKPQQPPEPPERAPGAELNAFKACAMLAPEERGEP
ncbi:hypothetical protein GCM10010505_43710 [Kitasatospora aburaviensis]